MVLLDSDSVGSPSRSHGFSSSPCTHCELPLGCKPPVHVSTDVFCSVRCVRLSRKNRPKRADIPRTAQDGPGTVQAGPGTVQEVPGAGVGGRAQADYKAARASSPSISGAGARGQGPSAAITPLPPHASAGQQETSHEQEPSSVVPVTATVQGVRIVVERRNIEEVRRRHELHLQAASSGCIFRLHVQTGVLKPGFRLACRDLLYA